MAKSRPSRRQAIDAAIDPAGSSIFAAPSWIRDLGLLAWFIVGVGVVCVGLIWILGVTSTIVTPVVVAGVVARGRRRPR